MSGFVIMHRMRNKADEATSEEKMTKEPKVYEVGYLLVASMSEEEVPAVYGNLKDLVSNLGGEVISDEMPKMMNLAYTMAKVVSNVRSKFDSAYFGWTKFYMSPEKVAELKKALDLDPKFIRFLIIKTIKENTVASRRFVGKDTIRRKAPASKAEGGEEVVMPINKEEIDKEIDALVQV